jgi:hypothetical protein
VAVLYASLPWRLLDPAWQLGISTTLLDNAPMPLVGLGLLHLAAFADPDNDAIQARRRSIAALAMAASIAFLLLIPLQGAAAWNTYRSATQQQTQVLRVATGKYAELRRAVAESGSVAEVQRRWQALLGARLNVDPSLPLAKVKEEVLAIVQGSEQQLRQQQELTAAGGIRGLILRTLRGMALALAFGFGFAAGAQRPGRKLSLLQEWRLALLMRAIRRRDKAAQGRARKGHPVYADYYEQIHDSAPDPLAAAEANPPQPPVPPTRG